MLEDAEIADMFELGLALDGEFVLLIMWMKIAARWLYLATKRPTRILLMTILTLVVMNYTAVLLYLDRNQYLQFNNKTS